MGDVERVLTAVFGRVIGDKIEITKPRDRLYEVGWCDAIRLRVCSAEASYRHISSLYAKRDECGNVKCLYEHSSPELCQIRPRDQCKCTVPYQGPPQCRSCQ